MCWQSHLKYQLSCLWGEPDAEDRSGCRYNEYSARSGTHYRQRASHAPGKNAPWCSYHPDVVIVAWARARVVLKGEVFAAMLPEVIEAVFYPDGGPVHHIEGDESRARIVHRRFARVYGLSGDRVPPLLIFDVDAARRRRAPFRMASDQT